MPDAHHAGRYSKLVSSSVDGTARVWEVFLQGGARLGGRLLRSTRVLDLRPPALPPAAAAGRGGRNRARAPPLTDIAALAWSLDDALVVSRSGGRKLSRTRTHVALVGGLLPALCKPGPAVSNTQIRCVSSLRVFLKLFVSRLQLH